MSRETRHWRLGLFIVAALAVGFGALLWLASGRSIAASLEGIPAVTYFDETVLGLDMGSSVKFRGIRIGRVDGFAIAPDGRRVEVRMSLDGPTVGRLGSGSSQLRGTDLLSHAVREGLRVRLTTQGLTGVKFVQAEMLDPADAPAPELRFAAPPHYVPPARSTFDQVEETILDARRRLPRSWDRADVVLERTERVLERLDTELAAFRQARVPEKLADTLDESRSSLSRALEGVERASKAIATQAEAAKIGETTQKTREAVEAVGELARRATPLADELREATAALRDAAARVRDAADVIERDPSSLIRGKRVAEASK